MWIALVGFYGVLKGFRDIIKKKAMEKSSAAEVLFFYTLISFLFVTPEVKKAVEIDFSNLGFIMIKSVIIFIAWICSFKAIKKLPIGFYGIMNMSQVLFASTLGIFVLSETLTQYKIIGMALVLVGLLFVNVGKKNTAEKVQPLYIILVLISCLGNAVSEMLDKMLMQRMDSSQLQFWYMFFLVVLYLGYMLVTRTKVQWRTLIKNYWIIILSVLFVVGDRALFIACSSKDSTVVAMTLIKQCSVMITIIGGRLIFKEKRTLYKLMCAAVIIAGIVFAVI
jgi:drug/metabolite transporter (DMT)-like permease